jgi:uncharacterized protein (DUF305 family)
MNFTPKAFKALRLASLATALCFSSVAAPAQTAVAPAASMPAGQMQHKGSAGASGTKDMKSSMMMGMESMQKMPASGDTDKDFAMMMKMHHQQALDMAEMELAQGKSPQMKAMATKIIAAQKKEIAEFDRWLAKQK